MSRRIKLPMTLTGVVSLLMLSTVTKAVAPVAFNYKNNGLDWPDKWSQCGAGAQSPIDLRTSNHSDPFPINYDDHDYIQSYESLLEPTLLQRGVNLYYDFPDAEGKQPTSRLNFFNSSWAVDSYGAASPIFNASQIFFHSKSEHTIDGQRFDLEMQVIHYPDDPSGNIKGASVSVLFDTKAWHNYTEEEEETIDAFFDSLVLDDLEKLDENKQPRDPFSYEVYFSTVTQLAQDYNRWVYKGSLTMPPCTSPWFVQVFHRVLPIKEEYLEIIQEWQKSKNRGQQSPSLYETGNWRETNIISDHNVTYLIQIEDREIEIIEKHGDLALLAILLVIAVGLSSAVCYFLCPSFKEALPEAPDLDDQGEEEEESPYADQSPVPTSEQELVKQQQMAAEQQEVVEE